MAILNACIKANAMLESHKFLSFVILLRYRKSFNLRMKIITIFIKIHVKGTEHTNQKIIRRHVNVSHANLRTRIVAIIKICVKSTELTD